MKVMPSILAKTVDVEEKLREAAPMLLLLFGILVGAVVLAGIIVYVVRRRSLHDDTTSTDIPLSLSEVRRMHALGEIDDDEMARLKDIVTGQAIGHAPASTPGDAEDPAEAEEKEA